MSKYVAGNIDFADSLAGLAVNTAVTAVLNNTVVDTARVTSIEVFPVIRGFTANEGPVMIGVALSDYTQAEIEEYLEQSSDWDPGNLVAQEEGSRRVRRIGTFAPQTVADAALNDGRVIKIKLNWKLMEGDTLQFWAYNQGGATLTSGTLEISGKANIFYQ